MTNETKKGGFPTWAKILIGIVAVGLVAIVGLVIVGVVFFQNVAKQTQNPAAISKVASNIGEFQSPLPPDYKMTMGINLAGMNVLTVQHNPDGQTIMFMSYPKVDGDAQSVIDGMANKSATMPQSATRIEVVNKRGTEMVGGEDMPYIIGVTSERGVKREALVGCIVPKGKEKTLIVVAAQPTGTYNLKETEDFLTTIKSFK